LCLKEIPSRSVLSEPAFVRLFQFGASLFVGINARLVCDPCCKHLQAHRPHSFFFRQLASPLDVDRAPNAAAPPRRETNLVADLVDALPNPVDPAKTSASSTDSGHVMLGFPEAFL
jgi:hypothetical protein